MYKITLTSQKLWCACVSITPPAVKRQKQSRQVCALMRQKLTADDYTDNIDPGQDPMRGARVCASYVDPLGSLGGTVQDSEDEEEPAQQPGQCSNSTT